MKKRIAFRLSLILIVTLSIGVSSAAAEDITVKSDMPVTFDGKQLEIAASGMLVNDSLYLPFRAIAEKIGAMVGWDDASGKVTMKKDSNAVSFVIGHKNAEINGVIQPIDVPARIIDDMTYVPVRFLSETLGLKVEYADSTRTVSLSTSDKPAMKVIGVNDGDILNGDNLKVAVAAYNHQLQDFSKNKAAKAGQGHIHLWLDTNPNDPKIAVKSFDGKAVSFENVAPGDHLLTVQLVGNDHKPVVPEVKKTIAFRTAKSPQLTIEGPAEGSVIKGDSVTVTTKVDDFKLVNFNTQPKVDAGEGHIHIWLDQDTSNAKIAYKQINADPVTFDRVKPGEHTLTVQLVHSNHQAIKPGIKQVIHFKTESAESYTLDMKDYAFVPSTLTVKAGAPITVINYDSAKHNAVAVNGAFRTPLLGENEKYTFTIDDPGEYDIYCGPHKSFMKGKIIVE